MKTHSTNYYDTFIQIADDCPVGKGTIPPEKADSKTLANMQFDMLVRHPYKYTSDDVVFAVHAQKKDLSTAELPKERETFFSKGQPCLRTSPLTKRYGWGIHYDAQGKIAIYGSESPEYEKFSSQKDLKVIKAIRSKKA